MLKSVSCCVAIVTVLKETVDMCITGTPPLCIVPFVTGFCSHMTIKAECTSWSLVFGLNQVICFVVGKKGQCTLSDITSFLVLLGFYLSP